MREVLFALLLMSSQVSFPLPNSAPGSHRLPEQGTIQGEVKNKAGEPIPLATISVRTQQDSARTDQRGGGVGWPGAVAKVQHDGTFRIPVPGDTTYQVCADVPTQTKQCRTVDVSANDVQMLLFTF